MFLLSIFECVFIVYLVYDFTIIIIMQEKVYRGRIKDISELRWTRQLETNWISRLLIRQSWHRLWCRRVLVSVLKGRRTFWA